MNKTVNNSLDLWQQGRVISLYCKKFPYPDNDKWYDNAQKNRFGYINTTSPISIL